MPRTGDGRLTRRALLVRAGSAAAALAVTRATSAGGAGRFPDAAGLDAEVPAAWFEQALALVRGTPGYSPPVASRAFAYAGLTLYEAVVPGMDGYRSLAGPVGGLGVPTEARNAAYDWALVTNAALASILRDLFPTAPGELRARLTALESSYADRLASGLPPGLRDRSIRRGRDVAAAVFAWSSSDGGHEGYARNFPPYAPPAGPAFWVPTPPGYQPALQPYWGANRCLALRGGDECPPGDHPPFSEEAGTAFYTEALEVYETAGGLSSEQEAIARFWSDDPGQTATPPGHSISIATQVLRREQASLARAAETYAKVGIAVCDAFIACWHAKYRSNLIRPVTYLRRLVDADWLPPLVTPPFPEYPSGHSVQSAAAAQVLTDLFGEGFAFVDHTHDDRGLPARSFRSFHEAANEAAISRLYGGIHYRAAIANGLEQGRCVGAAVSALPFRA